MNKFTISVLTTLLLGASLSALADDSMKGMDMNNMPAGSSMEKGSMHGMDMHGMDMNKMPMNSSTNAKVAEGVGVIKSIDPHNNMIVLNHQAIKELNWPPMTMGFKVADPKLLDGLKVGQQVSFELTTVGTKEVVTAIALAK